MKKKLSIVIPVYRSAGILSETHVKLSSVLNKLVKQYNYEIIYVNDGSDDSSLNELLKLKATSRHIKIVDLVRNFGQLSAILAGFSIAKGEAVIHISADLQDPPELILELVKHWKEGHKIVACERIEREDSFFTKITSKIFYRIIKFSIPVMPAGGFDFFLADKAVYKRIIEISGHNSFIQGDLLWLGYKPYFIKYKRLKRPVGKSQWTYAKKLKYFIDGLINTSYILIRAMSLLGLFISLLGFSYAIVIFVAKIFNNVPFQGYAPIMIVLLVASGLIMLMLGIIGEYLWRIYDETRKRPQYLVKDIYK